MASFDDWAAFRDSYGTGEDFLRRCYLNAPVPVRTGVPPLDAVLSGGLRPGVHVLGGEPGAGKSALALQVALMAAQRGNRSLYVSLEMDWAQCRSRCLALLSMEADGLAPFRWAEVPAMGRKLAKAMREGRERCGDESCVRDILRADPVAAANEFMAQQCAGLTIADADGLHDTGKLTEAAWEARDAGMGLMVVDYLQQLDYQGTGTEYDRVSAVSKALSRLAHSLGVPLLVLASMNRMSAAKDAPDMHGFRGSGGIEYDAETAMVLRKSDHDGHSADGVRLVELHVVKNRHGRQAEGSPIGLFFDGAHNRFTWAR
ncbi:DnaB-like helicase C-terminal domain-containing protein [Olsenella sp. HMSC062G07]|uniref:DnaB-like helicase C-terminal domain-containing protein n=1 Tax=Olsenella sp. HMSC062G07 TaxID=1739330 RepID=UPI0008A50475|nr:DnaB-like helicase C-terminal domain-containing protein [Olsenella sp. HMSC062G07]OFK23305.1 hypothetical protein HMPREF2826_05170 [Olsenella sp. HMSC062G07]